ncbi:MAG: T9SS type A sorting domain-containing protein [Chitinophagales bacterium]|nr:T9SS type A sorting domain-containing protein [Chitinophagales bacterium]
MKRYFLVVMLIIQSLSYLNGQIRFQDDIFTDADIRFRDILYAKVDKSLCWNRGDTNALHHFTAFNYTIDNSYLKDTFNLHMRFIDTKNDTMTARPVVIFVKSGYLIPVNDGLRSYFGSKEDTLLRIFIRKGFAVVVFDFRRGWDAKEYFTKECFGTEYKRRFPYAFCEQADVCSQFSFIGSIYRVCQDLRAVHRKLLSMQDSLRIDPQKVIYFGSSTGSYVTMLATYAAQPQEFPAYLEVAGDTNSMTLAERYGPLDMIGYPYPVEALKVAACLSLTGAIKDTAYLNADDKTPLIFSQGIEDQDVFFCKESLTSGYYSVPSEKAHLTFDGFGVIMEKINQIRLHDTTFQAIGNVFKGVGHAYYEDKCELKDLRMKCGNTGASGYDCPLGNSADRLSFIGLFVKQIFPLMNNNRIVSTLNYFDNANACEACDVISCELSGSYCKTGSFDCLSTGIRNPITALDVQLFPTILSKSAHLNINAPSVIKVVNIVDALGDLLATIQPKQVATSFSFKHSFQNAGIYFIRIETENGISVKKIMVN